ncbi:AI-2E family transporter [Candidatus Saccharibacteria bacterium]|nr:AI-2E family transporter [Candidatus Saccharibacteria bacterium]
MSNKIEVDTKTFVRFWLVILGLGLAALFIWQAATGLLIVGISLFLAIAISPLVNKVASVIPGKGRKLPTTIAYIIVMAVLCLILTVIVPAVISETTKFVTNLPTMVEDVTSNLGWVDDLGDKMGIVDLREQFMGGIEAFSVQFVQDFGTNILNSVGAIGSFLAAFILILVLTFLMLMEGPGMLKMFWRKFERNKKAQKMQKALDRMTEVVAKFASGEIIVGLINGFSTTVVVFILSIIFRFSPGLALPFGLITGVLCMVPMFGAFIGGVLVALLLAVSNVWAGVAFFAYYLIYMQVEANVVTPRIQSKNMRLPALIVLAVVTIGVYMFGLIGAIIAIPIAGCIKVLIEEYGASAEAKD